MHGACLHSELHGAIACVGAAKSDQLIVRAFFDNAPFIDDGNLVGTADGGKPVRDYERGASLRQLGE